MSCLSCVSARIDKGGNALLCCTLSCRQTMAHNVDVESLFPLVPSRRLSIGSRSPAREAPSEVDIQQFGADELHGYNAILDVPLQVRGPDRCMLQLDWFSFVP